jgi:hypothetical protein
MAIELPTTHDARDDKGASSSGASLLSPEMMAIIHGSDAGKDKKAEYEKSLQRWVFELGRHDDAALTRATRYALRPLLARQVVDRVRRSEERRGRRVRGQLALVRQESLAEDRAGARLLPGGRARERRNRRDETMTLYSFDDYHVSLAAD